MDKKLFAKYLVLKEAVADIKRRHSDEAKAEANVKYALQEQQYAMKAFPGKTVGEALALFHKTDLGKRIQKDALAENYTKMQLESALGNVSKRGQNTVRYYQTKPGDNGDGMDNVDWSNDVEATKAHRAEQARKAQG
jgi:hypothetical protein